MTPEIGEKYRRYDNKLLHVRGLVDDCVVVRWWRIGKQRWEYEVIDLCLWEWMVKRKHVEKIK